MNLLRDSFMRQAALLLALMLWALIAAAQPISWQELCSNATLRDFKPPAIAKPLAEAELPSCNEQQLYYGFERKPDPAAALQCGYFQRAHDRPEIGDPFYGPGVLSMLYANGIGVARDIDMAIRFSCENRWAAEAEMDSRLAHLERLRQTPADAAKFDLCDAATSGLMGGACSSIRSRWKEFERSSKLAAIQLKWTLALKTQFQEVLAAEAAFAIARSGNEQDMIGTAKEMFVIQEQDRLSDQVLINLREFATGQIPQATAAQANASDEEMKLLLQHLAYGYRKPAFAGAIAAEGIVATQQSWLATRRAWLALGRLAWPALDPDRIRSRLTRQRIRQLRRLETDLRYRP